MSTLEIVFVHKDKKNDERVFIDRMNSQEYTLGFKADASKKLRYVNFATPESVRDYVTSMLNMVIHDDDPCVGIQFFFPASPTVLYKHSTLKKDDVWDAMLDALDFWLDQPKWPKLPPISPIIPFMEEPTTELPEFIDLSEPEIKLEYNVKNNQRNVTVLPNRHTFFDESGCPCSRFCR